MSELELWRTYGRRAVHDYFSPDTTFTPQAGSWGLWGIVRVPHTTSDFVFFVTFGASTGGHDFEEEITDEGVLTWQSQPSQRIATPAIQEFIAHDSTASTIHLFLRTRAGDEYTYFGPIAYVSHDPAREAPVWFTWQILNWPLPASVIQRSGVTVSASSQDQVTQPSQSPGLSLTPPPAPRTKVGSSPGLVKRAYLPNQDARNAELGKAGEMLVVERERSSLIAAGRADLANKVIHVPTVFGDGAGYDVLSYEPSGKMRHIEVKTTRGGRSTAFFISPNEVRFSDDHPDSFVLMRVYGFRDNPLSASAYELPGSVRDHFDLKTTEYQATIKPQATP